MLGAGTMGSRIAAHLANAGLPVVLLDISAEGGARSAIAAQALDALKKSKPSAFYDPAYAARIRVGNFDDDLELLADCDWVIEAVTENLAIKQALLDKVAPQLKLSSGLQNCPLPGLCFQDVLNFGEGKALACRMDTMS